MFVKKFCNFFSSSSYNSTHFMIWAKRRTMTKNRIKKTLLLYAKVRNKEKKRLNTEVYFENHCMGLEHCSHSAPAAVATSSGSCRVAQNRLRSEDTLRGLWPRLFLDQVLIADEFASNDSERKEELKGASSCSSLHLPSVKFVSANKPFELPLSDFMHYHTCVSALS